MPVLLESVEVIHETDAAYLIEFDDGSTEPVEGVNRFWIPKSVIAEPDFDEIEVGEIVDLQVRTWFADKCEGLRECIDLCEDNNSSDWK